MVFIHLTTALQTIAVILITAALVSFAAGIRIHKCLSLLHAGTALLLAACVVADGTIWPRTAHLVLAWMALGVSQSFARRAARPTALLLGVTQAVLMTTGVVMSDVYDVFALRRTLVAAVAIPSAILLFDVWAAAIYDDMTEVSPADCVILVGLAAMAGLHALLSGSAVEFSALGYVNTSDPLWRCSLLVACTAGHICHFWGEHFGVSAASGTAVLLICSIAVLLAILGRPYDGVACAVVAACSLRSQGIEASASCAALAAVCAFAASMAPSDLSAKWAIWSGESYWLEYYRDFDQTAAASVATGGLPLGEGIGAHIGVWSNVPSGVAPAIMQVLRVFGLPGFSLLSIAASCAIFVGINQFTAAGRRISGGLLVSMGLVLGMQILTVLGFVPNLSLPSSPFLATASLTTPLVQAGAVALAVVVERRIAEGVRPMPIALPAPPEETVELLEWLEHMKDGDGTAGDGPDDK